MKKIVLLTWLCCASAAGFAQDLGKTLISGSASYSTSGTKNNFASDHREHRFSISPRVGFFVSPSWAVGLAAGYESSTSPSNMGIMVNGNYVNITVDHDFHSYTVGPFVRYYKAAGNKAAFFGQANVNYRYGKSGSDDFPAEYPYSHTTSKGGEINLMPGFVFFPTNTIGLEFMVGNIGYSSMKVETEGSNSSIKSNSFNANFGLDNITLGLSLYLGRSAAE